MNRSFSPFNSSVCCTSCLVLLLGSSSIARAQEAPAEPAPQPAAAPQAPPSAETPPPVASKPLPSAETKPQLSLQDLGVNTPDAPGDAPGRDDLCGCFENRTIGNYLWPLADVIIINLGLWSVPYVMGVPFAQVTPEYWVDNVRAGFQWDDNEFEVNQFAHPYQGGMYFSAARVNGLSFWESVPYVMFGSYTWENFLETEQPSTNDWMTTTWGGTFFGEALYRLSNYVVDESVSGSARFWKEFAAFAVNPVNGLDRIISGRVWVDGPAPKPIPLAVNLRVGPDGIGLSEGTGWGESFRARVEFDYGDLYAKPSLTTPFSVFDFSAQLNVGKDLFGQAIDGTGLLVGHRFSMGESSINLLAWSMNFEYYTNATTKMLTRESDGVYQLGEMGTGVSWYGHWDLGYGLALDSQVHALAVPTGAITSPYAKYEANRSYSYGLGGATKVELELVHERLGKLYAHTDRYLYYVVDGARGTEHVGVLTLGVYGNIYRGHGLGATAILYDRHSNYDDYQNISDTFWSGQLHYEVEF